MVQHSSAHDLIEVLPELGDGFERQLPQFQIVDAVLALELCGRLNACVADVDARHMCVRPAQRMFRRLRRSAADDEDAAVVAKRFTWPKEMCLGAPALTISGSRVALQIVEPERVRMLLVNAWTVTQRQRRRPGRRALPLLREPVNPREGLFSRLGHLLRRRRGALRRIGFRLLGQLCPSRLPAP